MPLHVKPGTQWTEVYDLARKAAPEAFDADRILNLSAGEWRRSGTPGEHVTPVDGSTIAGPPRIGHEEAAQAVQAASGQHREWGQVDLDERRSRVSAAVDAMQA